MSVLKRIGLSAVIALFVVSCTDSADDTSGNTAGSEDSAGLVLGPKDAGIESDIPLIQPDPPPAPPAPDLTREERCAHSFPPWWPKRFESPRRQDWQNCFCLETL